MQRQQQQQRPLGGQRTDVTAPDVVVTVLLLSPSSFYYTVAAAAVAAGRRTPLHFGLQLLSRARRQDHTRSGVMGDLLKPETRIGPFSAARLKDVRTTNASGAQRLLCVRLFVSHVHHTSIFDRSLWSHWRVSYCRISAYAYQFFFQGIDKSPNSQSNVRAALIPLISQFFVVAFRDLKFVVTT